MPTEAIIFWVGRLLVRPPWFLMPKKFRKKLVLSQYWELLTSFLILVHKLYQPLRTGKASVMQQIWLNSTKCSFLPASRTPASGNAGSAYIFLFKKINKTRKVHCILLWALIITKSLCDYNNSGFESFSNCIFLKFYGIFQWWFQLSLRRRASLFWHRLRGFNNAVTFS